jgi:hypothetical protein
MGKPLYRTARGRLYLAQSEEFLRSTRGRRLKGKVQLLLTSPPFPLNKKKRYGNKMGDDYRAWFAALAEPFADLLTDDGSIVVELGNAWEPGRPVQSLLPLECLLGFAGNGRAGLRLCQQFVCYNPSRLPSPAEWVTVRRVRMTDSFTQVWWFAKSDLPKADNRRVLRPYSGSMRKLLSRQSYNAGGRPSQHRLSENGFLKEQPGSIMPNVIELDPPGDGRPVRLPENILNISNTTSNDRFLRACRERGLRPHPARMQPELAAFFIQFLTDPGDLVLDPFAGSNTTGFAAERLGRRWVSIEAMAEYGEQSAIRFERPPVPGRARAAQGSKP